MIINGDAGGASLARAGGVLVLRGAGQVVLAGRAAGCRGLRKVCGRALEKMRGRGRRLASSGAVLGRGCAGRASRRPSPSFVDVTVL